MPLSAYGVKPAGAGRPAGVQGAVYPFFPAIFRPAPGDRRPVSLADGGRYVPLVDNPQGLGGFGERTTGH